MLKRFFVDSSFSKQRDLVENDTTNIKYITTPHFNISCVASLGKDVYRDLELFVSNDERSESVVESLNTCVLLGSKEYLKTIVENPITDVELLRTRQNILNKIVGLYNTSDDDILKELKGVEEDFLWLFQKREDNLNNLYDIIYFRFWIFKHLNKSETCLTLHNLYRIVLSPVIGILSPIVYFILPFMILRMKLKLKVSLKMYLTFLWQSSSIFLDSKLLVNYDIVHIYFH
jgi:hypothetical protein